MSNCVSEINTYQRAVTQRAVACKLALPAHKRTTVCILIRGHRTLVARSDTQTRETDNGTYRHTYAPVGDAEEDAG